MTLPGERKKLALVTTTINVPVCLEEYARAYRESSYAGDLAVVVVADLKTPPEVGDYVRGLEWGKAEVHYLDVAAQAKLGHAFPLIDRLIPWNTIQRRNIGYLRAVQAGCDGIITIDDDNYNSSDDFFAHHATVGCELDLPSMLGRDGWANCCDVLESDRGPFVPRGWPAGEVGDAGTGEWGERTGRVAVNAGLWLGDPDIDAVTRLANPVDVSGFRVGVPRRFTSALGTWCPFNSQNTAFLAETLPAMYLFVMGAEYRGNKVGRYDDIWMSYVLRTIVDHLGDLIVYGDPLVRQDRNEHDLLNDLSQELPGMILQRRFLEVLRGSTFTGANYAECASELAAHLRSELVTSAQPGPERNFWEGIVTGMEQWLELCSQIK